MTTQLCGARYRHNMGITCGKQPGHLEQDPLHKFDPADEATLEWFDYDSYRPTTPDLLARLQASIDQAKSERTETPATEQYPVIPDEEKRPLGWLFNKGVRADG